MVGNALDPVNPFRMKRVYGFLALFLFVLAAGCARTSSPSQPNNSLINRQGDVASIAPLDHAKTAAAAASLQSDAELAPFRLDVKVFAKTAQLSGTVKTDAQKTKAERIVKSIPGIDQVENKIQVAP